jgi:four helix bundle protein
MRIDRSFNLKGGMMPYKFEKLEVWQLSVEYSDRIYKIAEMLPRNEEYNLRSQITRAATSVSLNTAEGLTSQTDAEQARFVPLATRSRRKFSSDPEPLREAYRFSEKLFAKLEALRNTLKELLNSVREESSLYEAAEPELELPFNP